MNLPSAGLPEKLKTFFSFVIVPFRVIVFSLAKACFVPFSEDHVFSKGYDLVC
jgi:hypothetical protein